MNKSILGSFIGISIVLSIDSLSRVFIALYHEQSILMFSYSAYPGIWWAVILTAIAFISTFLGGLFAFTYGKTRQYICLLVYALLIILLRYAQIHLLYETETIFYPVAALILSLLAIFFAWKLIRPAAVKKTEEEEFREHHHHPADDGG